MLQGTAARPRLATTCLVLAGRRFAATAHGAVHRSVAVVLFALPVQSLLVMLLMRAAILVIVCLMMVCIMRAARLIMVFVMMVLLIDLLVILTVLRRWR